MNTREGFKQMVEYLLPKEDHNEEIIESYTESLMIGAELYFNKKLEQLELLIKLNEDEFDQGKGKYILRDWINKNRINNAEK